jgi:FdhE protein
MPRTAAGLRTDPAARLAELGRERPEWAVWLQLLGEAERAVASHESGARPSWAGSRESPIATSPDAPLLHGCTLEVNAAELQRLIRRLATMASALEGGTSLSQYRPTANEAVRLIGAAMRQDRDQLAAAAAAQGLDAGALASVIHLAALPLLRTCGRMLQDRIPRHWPHGYCPICAAWPTLAERRGLDRSRRLRCGRCAGEWEIEWLICVYCGERNHQRLGSLVSEEDGDRLKVETCASCQGYLKSVATLQAIPAFELLLRDLETVELDLVALDRGYVRPEESGYRLEVELSQESGSRESGVRSQEEGKQSQKTGGRGR